MPTLTIDQQTIKVDQDAVILDAARKLNINIPTLCYLQDHALYTSCMICVVQDRRTGKMVPACSTPVEEGMEIETENEAIGQRRRDILELLFSEHVGDCEGPCRQICPARMDIPGMIRLIQASKPDQALGVAAEALVFPGILGYICPAPCVKGCRRAEYDHGVAIAGLHRRLAEEQERELPTCAEPMEDQVHIVGAGPAGLSAAYALSLAGVICHVYDDHEQTGGMLRYGVANDTLPRSILNRELHMLEKLPITFHLGVKVGESVAVQSLAEQGKALVLAAGQGVDDLGQALGLEKSTRGLSLDPATHATSRAGVFAVKPSRGAKHMAVRAVAAGCSIADALLGWLRRQKPDVTTKRFNCAIGRLKQGEIDNLLPDAANRQRAQDAMKLPLLDEAHRCLLCDCLKANDCRLRELAERYGLQRNTLKRNDRPLIHKIRQHPDVVYEPGKCIKCGICVRLSEGRKEPLGMSFIGRGFDTRIDVPFKEPLDQGMTTSAELCVTSCPTAALAKQAISS